MLRQSGSRATGRKPGLEPTYDPYIFIEEQRPGYWRYFETSTGRRWEVIGECDQRGDCLIGAVLDDGTQVRDHAHLAQLQRERGKFRILTDLDVPVSAPDCCPFEIRWLNGND